MNRLLLASGPAILAGPLACLLAACGDDGRPTPDTGADGCAAEFTDNFAETSRDAANCATLETAGGHTTLKFAVPSQKISAPFEIAIDLGESPAPGLYTSQSLATPWSADALHEFEMTSCLYHAGTAAVPPGTFRLMLDTVDVAAAAPAAHGNLEVTLYVLARPYTYCGETNVERLTVAF
jgi:hypothetical protein